MNIRKNSDEKRKEKSNISSSTFNINNNILYDKIIQRHFKQDIEEIKYYSAPVVNTGMNSDIRKFIILDVMKILY